MKIERRFLDDRKKMEKRDNKIKREKENGKEEVAFLGLAVSVFFVDARTGNIGIGTASLSNTLDVRGTGNFSGTIFINNNTDISTLLGGGNINGLGTVGFIPVFNGTSDINNSVIFQNGSNVGIGLINPSQKLHVSGDMNVSGLCVSEDSWISMSDGGKKKIKDINAGEYVQSLDEEAGKLVNSKVKALLDMGEKPIYELCTEGGKCVNTTSIHPYLTDEGWKKVSELKEGEEIAVSELKQSQFYLAKNISTNSEVKYILTSFCFKNAFSLVQIAEPSNNARAKYGASLEWGANFSALDNISLVNLTIGNILILSLRISNTSITSDSETLQISAIVPVFLLNSSIRYDDAINLNLSSKNKSYVLAFPIIAANKTVASTISSIYSPSENLFSTNSEILSVNSLASLSETLILDENILSFFNFSALSNIAFKAISFQSSLNSCMLSSNSSGIFMHISAIKLLNKEDYLNFSVDKTNEKALLFQTFDSYESSNNEKDIILEKIISIKQHSSQHVYDLMIEGTHNFIANDIVAHNTYIYGNTSIDGSTFFVDTTNDRVGIGTTGPGGKLHATGGDVIFDI